jgi:hypothetical protein
MAKIKKKSVPKHLLVVDTSELWQEVKNEVVSEIFEKFWDEHGDKYTLELNIPEVVKGEIVFQHTTSALKALDRANNQFENMSRAANKKYQHSITPSKIKKDVELKVSRWLKSKNSIIVDTPIDDIAWSELIEKSIWRRKPFTEDHNTEKGFRDSLILETLKSISNKNTSSDIAFVTRDKLLRESAIEEFKGNKKVACFESIEQFSSYLKLMDEKLTADFIKSIQKRAREKFHDASTHTGLLLNEGIIRFIKDNFSTLFSAPFTGGLGGLLSPGSGIASPPSNKWEELSDESAWIQSPDFERLEEGNVYYWSSTVSFVQLFKYNSVVPSGLLSSLSDGQKNIRILPFNVRWKANVKVDGRFHNIEFIEVKPGEKRFEMPSSDDIERYRLGNHFET